MQEQQDYARRSFVLAAREEANEDGRVRPHPKCLDLLGRMRKGNLQTGAIKDAGGPPRRLFDLANFDGDVTRKSGRRLFAIAKLRDS
jgi:hypothetical protein